MVFGIATRNGQAPRQETAPSRLAQSIQRLESKWRRVLSKNSLKSPLSRSRTSWFYLNKSKIHDRYLQTTTMTVRLHCRKDRLPGSLTSASSSRCLAVCTVAGFGPTEY